MTYQFHFAETESGSLHWILELDGEPVFEIPDADLPDRQSPTILKLLARPGTS